MTWAVSSSKRATLCEKKVAGRTYEWTLAVRALLFSIASPVFEYARTCAQRATDLDASATSSRAPMLDVKTKCATTSYSRGVVMLIGLLQNAAGGLFTDISEASDDRPPVVFFCQHHKRAPMIHFPSKGIVSRQTDYKFESQRASAVNWSYRRIAKP